MGEERPDSGTWATVQPVDPDAPFITLNFIDTPGLDDSGGELSKGLEVLEQTLYLLPPNLESGNLTQHGYPDAILMILNSNYSISQNVQHMYSSLCRMPMAGNRLGIVSIRFTTSSWMMRHHQSQQETASDLHISSGKNIPETWRRMLQRLTAFHQLFRDRPRQFFIDTIPRHRYPYEEFLTLNCITDMLKFISNRDEGVNRTGLHP
ncbi:hypothetical protein K432DRAFT_469239 [Lepidopterella palustris CBS 459.81]|uniref:Uncharacterized protein n=1 Tax=Lepidopterella palustris CBS 459.81 TaxID=1314670 RepID=A0A8E2DZJ3_9PEZI|nr:hypothetical protein K432DRAFT_469239 [Lepidopterella palustris CBS 459.81]